MKSYYFNEEHEIFRQGLRAFLDKEVNPHIDQWEEDRRIPKELWKKFGDIQKCLISSQFRLIYPKSF